MKTSLKAAVVALVVAASLLSGASTASANVNAYPDTSCSAASGGSWVAGTSKYSVSIWAPGRSRIGSPSGSYNWGTSTTKTYRYNAYGIRSGEWMVWGGGSTLSISKGCIY